MTTPHPVALPVRHSCLICTTVTVWISSLATSDYTSTTGKATITEDALRQCVSIPIKTDSVTETTNQCFTFKITSSSTVDGLTVSPSQTEICIVDKNCEFCNTKVRAGSSEYKFGSVYKTSRDEHLPKVY